MTDLPLVYYFLPCYFIHKINTWLYIDYCVLDQLWYYLHNHNMKCIMQNFQQNYFIKNLLVTKNYYISLMSSNAYNINLVYLIVSYSSIQNISEQAHNNSTYILIYVHITSCSARITLIENDF